MDSKDICNAYKEIYDLEINGQKFGYHFFQSMSDADMKDFEGGFVQSSGSASNLYNKFDRNKLLSNEKDPEKLRAYWEALLKKCEEFYKSGDDSKRFVADHILALNARKEDIPKITELNFLRPADPTIATNAIGKGVGGLAGIGGAIAAGRVVGKVASNLWKPLQIITRVGSAAAGFVGGYLAGNKAGTVLGDKVLDPWLNKYDSKSGEKYFKFLKQEFDAGRLPPKTSKVDSTPKPTPSPKTPTNVSTPEPSPSPKAATRVSTPEPTRAPVTLTDTLKPTPTPSPKTPTVVSRQQKGVQQISPATGSQVNSANIQKGLETLTGLNNMQVPTNATALSGAASPAVVSQAMQENKNFLQRNWELLLGALAVVGIGIFSYLNIRKSNKKAKQAKQENAALSEKVSSLQTQLDDLKNPDKTPSTDNSNTSTNGTLGNNAVIVDSNVLAEQINNMIKDNSRV